MLENIYIELEIIKQNSQTIIIIIIIIFTPTLSKFFRRCMQFVQVEDSSFSPPIQPNRSFPPSSLFAHDKLLIAQSCVHFEDDMRTLEICSIDGKLLQIRAEFDSHRTLNI